MEVGLTSKTGRTDATAATHAPVFVFRIVAVIIIIMTMMQEAGADREAVLAIVMVVAVGKVVILRAGGRHGLRPGRHHDEAPAADASGADPQAEGGEPVAAR